MGALRCAKKFEVTVPDNWEAGEKGLVNNSGLPGGEDKFAFYLC